MFALQLQTRGGNDDLCLIDQCFDQPLSICWTRSSSRCEVDKERFSVVQRSMLIYIEGWMTSIQSRTEQSRREREKGKKKEEKGKRRRRSESGEKSVPRLFLPSTSSFPGNFSPVSRGRPLSAPPSSRNSPSGVPFLPPMEESQPTIGWIWRHWLGLQRRSRVPEAERLRAAQRGDSEATANSSPSYELAIPCNDCS